MIYSSFNHYSIRKIQEMMPEAETAYLFGDVIMDVPGYSRYNEVKVLHPPLYQVQMPGLLKEYLRSGLPVRVWTADKEEDLEMLMCAGVAAVFTNRPDRAVKVRNSN